MMGHRIEWDNEEKTVVLQQYEPGATKNDLYQLALKSEEMLKSVSHTVHLIIDETNIQLLLTAADMSFLEKHAPPNQGAAIVVVPRAMQPYKEMVNKIGKRVAPHAFDEPLFAPSLEEARRFLQEALEVRYP